MKSRNNIDRYKERHDSIFNFIASELNSRYTYLSVPFSCVTCHCSGVKRFFNSSLSISTVILLINLWNNLKKNAIIATSTIKKERSLVAALSSELRNYTPREQKRHCCLLLWSMDDQISWPWVNQSASLANRFDNHAFAVTRGFYKEKLYDVTRPYDLFSFSLFKLYIQKM